MSGPLARYRAMVERGDMRADEAQERAAIALERLYDDIKRPSGLFRRKKSPKGIYLHGGVGRGKSMLMDLFCGEASAITRARRLHFHEFMLETHDWLHAKRQGGVDDDLLPRYASYVAGALDLICFDEFHVTDVADAMILSRLFTALLDHGVVVVATSNWPPEKLYEGGLQRARFLPFIDLIQERLEIVPLEGSIDYREAGTADAGNYFYPLGQAAQAKMDEIFERLSGGQEPREEILTVKGRAIRLQSANNMARASFSQLCEQPHGAEDYLAIAHRFHTVFIEGIPRMGYDRRNEIKRLMTLIDVLYDNRIRVYISADEPPERLNHGHAHAFEFERTISRLSEMQSSSYGKNHA